MHVCLSRISQQSLIMASGMYEHLKVKAGECIFWHLHANVFTLKASERIRELVQRLLVTNTTWEQLERQRTILVSKVEINESLREPENGGPIARSHPQGRRATKQQLQSHTGFVVAATGISQVSSQIRISQDSESSR